MNRPSRLLGLYVLASYGFGGLLIGLVLHSFPAFRSVALVVACIVAMLLVGLIGYPMVQERLHALQRSGVGRIYPGSQGRPKLIDASLLITIFTPLIALVMLIALGFFIGMR